MITETRIGMTSDAPASSGTKGVPSGTHGAAAIAPATDKPGDSKVPPVLPAPWTIPVGGILIKIEPERCRRGKDKIPGIRFRLSHWVGSTRISTIRHIKATLEEEAKKWGKQFNSAHSPRSAATLKQQQQQSLLYEECLEVLSPYKMPPLSACQYMARLLELMDVEGLEKLIAVFLPLLRKCKPLLIRVGIKEYRDIIFKGGKPQTDDEKRKDQCLTLFDKSFGGTQYLFVTAKQIDAFLKAAAPGQDLRNKYLYCLRAMFVWARDVQEALPARQDTVCDLIKGKRPKYARPEIYDVKEYAWLAGVAADRETVFGLAVTGKQFVRQEEAEKLRGEFFLRDQDGMPYEITVPEDVSKTGEERSIPIQPRLRPLFKVLVPPAGRIFHSKKPFARIENLASALGIETKPNGLRHGCVSYSIGAGMKRKTAAKLAGHNLDTQGTFYFVKVDPRKAKQYERIVFNLGRVSQLPLYKRVNFKRLAKKFRRTFKDFSEKKNQGTEIQALEK